MINFYGNSVSPPCRAVLLLMTALNVEYNLIPVNVNAGDNYKANYIKMNPLHTIPTIVDEDFIVYDSHVIMQYLVNAYAEDDAFYPNEPQPAALVNQRLFFNAAYLWPRYGEFIKPVMLMNQLPDESKVQNLEEALNYLDLFLKELPWLAGPSLTIADFAVIPIISTLDAIGFDIEKFPNLYSWYERTKHAMSGYEYDEVNQKGADMVGKSYKCRLENVVQ